MDSQPVPTHKTHPPHSCQPRSVSILKRRPCFIWLRLCLCNLRAWTKNKKIGKKFFKSKPVSFYYLGRPDVDEGE